MIPKLIRYHDASYGNLTFDYLVNEDEKFVYLCSRLTYQLAEELGRENELGSILARKLEKMWISFQYEAKEKTGRITYPAIIQINKEKVLEVIQEHFYYIEGISRFLDHFFIINPKENLIKKSEIAIIVGNIYLPNFIIQKLFRFVFDSYPDIIEEQKFEFLFHPKIGPFFLNYLDENLIPAPNN